MTQNLKTIQPYKALLAENLEPDASSQLVRTPVLTGLDCRIYPVKNERQKHRLIHCAR